jgi:hypothetical protein
LTKLAELTAKTLLLLAALAVLTAITLFVCAGWLLSWPLRRRSPRIAQMQAAMQVAASLAALAAVAKRSDEAPPARR